MRKYLLLFISILFLGFNIVYAEVKVYDRNDLDNYGVNKHWDITGTNKSNVLKTYAVDADEKVYDFAGILKDEEISRLRDLSNSFYKKTKMEMIILTDDFYNTTDRENEVFAEDFYDYNDFGLKDKYYSGVLIFRNAYEEDPFYNIYTFGEARLYFPNQSLEAPLDLVYSDMVSKNYLVAFSSIINELSEAYDYGMPSSSKGYYLDKNGMLIEKYSMPLFEAILISGIATAIVICILVKRNKMIYREALASNYFEQGSLVFTRREDQFIHSRTTSYSLSSSSGGGGRSSGGGGSSRGSSGGGHGGGSGRRG